ncbi:ferritin-like domain-containing protein [Dysosmobacter sp.]|uniref:ferritin-like domain-containing protein n=1 Tax=Dysosmobacter sp. TaxID=2591382 RepID=UPI003AB6E05D
MEQNLHTPASYDYRQYDRVWQRVAPGLEPYPDMKETEKRLAELRTAQGPAVPAMESTPLPEAPEGQLPGAEPDPCCMGTAAEELLEVLEGFIEVELADRRHYLALSRQAPAFARQQVRQLAEEAGCAARQLMAACYLITGECYRPAVECGRICLGRWCAAVRERYHAEACNGMNYLRAAESTTDPCLERLLTELGEASYRQADALLCLLQKSL